MLIGDFTLNKIAKTPEGHIALPTCPSLNSRCLASYGEMVRVYDSVYDSVNKAIDALNRPLLKLRGLFLAGGSVRDRYFNKECNDYDFYILLEKPYLQADLKDFIAELSTENSLNLFGTSDANIYANFAQKKIADILLKIEGIEYNVDLIFCDNNKISKVLNDFDINICQHAFGRYTSCPKGTYYLIHHDMLHRQRFQPGGRVREEEFLHHSLRVNKWHPLTPEKTIERFLRFAHRYDLPISMYVFNYLSTKQHHVRMKKAGQVCVKKVLLEQLTRERKFK